MIQYTKGDILKADVEALVNTVNIVGVMGKGIALAFKKAFPENFEAYYQAYQEGNLEIGKMLVFPTQKMFPKYIINFPTKKHWRHPSKYEYVREGLIDLVEVIKEYEIQSIAIPPLGCGNGKLDWNIVRSMIEESLSEIAESRDIILYEPGYQPPAKNDPSGQKPVKLTNARAMLLYLMHQYDQLGYTLNLLVIQKLAYFLQKTGEPLRLDYEKGWYGPYARKLQYVLKALNGTYLFFSEEETRPNTTVKLAYNKSEYLNQFIAEKLSEDQKSRLDQVLNLIEGFESPFGLELLGTVDYISSKNQAYSAEDIHAHIQDWTTRKKELMPLDQIEVALEQLNARVGQDS